MCSCESLKVISDYYTEICTECGCETNTHLTQEPIYMPCATIDRSYSRNDRWKGLVRKITGYHNGPSTSDPIWKYLEKSRPFTHPQKILDCLRKSKLTNKHYQSLYAFTVAFAPTYKVPRVGTQVTPKLISYFNFVYGMWNKYFGDKPFFSYNWLIEQALYFYNFEAYLPFIKHLVCPKRRRKYEHLLITLYGIQLGIENYTQQRDRSRCVRSNSSNPRNQLCGLCYREFEPADPHKQGSQLCFGCRSIILRGAVQKCSS